MSTSSLVTPARGSAVQAVAFACEHGIPPAEVPVSIEHAAGLFEQAPTAEELAIINSA